MKFVNSLKPRAAGLVNMNTTRDQKKGGGDMDVLVAQIVIRDDKIKLLSENMDVRFTVDWKSEKSRKSAAVGIGRFCGDIFARALVQRGYKPGVKPTRKK